VRRALLAVATVACLTSLARAQRGADSTGRVVGGILGRTPIDARKDIAFQAVVLPETVYVGQQATYQVGVFLSDDIRARLRRNPQFVPPEVRSVLAFDLPSPSIAMTRTIGDRRFDVHIFQRALFPLTAGRQEIPSARLDYALPLSNSFFAREENHSERTGALFLVARDPPVTGRPQDYRGAVGRLTATAHFDARQARVGDPLVYTMSIEGIGNVNLLPRPPLQLGWADVVPGDERVQLDSNATLLRGKKHFDWIITPRRPGLFMMPPLRYPHFNPYTERYEVAITPAESLRVAPGGVAAAAPKAVDSVPALPIRRIFSGNEPAPLTSWAGYWLVIAFAPVPALLLGLTRRPARRAAPTHDRLLRTLASSRAPIDAPTLRRAYASAIAARVMATPAAMSHHTELVRTLRRAGVSAQTANAAEALLAELDAIVFGRSGPLPANAARRAHDVVRAVDVEARSRQDIAARLARVASLMLLVVAAVAAGAAERDAVALRVFAEGVKSYDGHDFNTARATFFELTRERPRAADAWANFGTASWEAHDTAAAVVGWQRALRLQPLSADVRQSLELTPGYAGGFFGDVAPVSLTMIGLAGGVFWIVGWVALTLTARRERARSRAGTWSVGVALVVALLGLVQRDVLDGRHAVVVVNAVRLRSGPALGAETGAETITGEVARVEGRQGAWTRLRLSDGRRGWVESRQLQPLGVE
jgi:hypothetical protein